MFPGRKAGMRFSLFACLLLLINNVGAAQYLSVPDFLRQAFDGDAPTVSMLWLDQKQRDEAERISGEDPGFRVRYWHHDGRTAWVLDAVGRDRPITMGFVVDGGELRQMRVLAFRESRGWEIRHEFFTRQFRGLSLDDDKLSGDIDGISGATLSVRATQRAARLALWLHRQVMLSSS